MRVSAVSALCTMDRLICAWIPAVGPTAAEFVNTVSETEFVRVLRRYGEERFAKRIAGAIVEQRALEPFDNHRTVGEGDYRRQSCLGKAQTSGDPCTFRLFVLPSTMSLAISSCC